MLRRFRCVSGRPLALGRLRSYCWRLLNLAKGFDYRRAPE